MKKETQNEVFIAKAIKVHKTAYDYSKVSYINSKTKITILCNKHGDFEQTPNQHLSGSGCPKCVRKSITTEEFIEKAKLVHEDKYAYSKIAYTNKATKVIITCPIHGDFEQTPNNHLKGQGCQKCHLDKLANAHSSSREQFITKANITHNNFYAYENTTYLKSSIKIIITCPIHGDFEQTPRDHLCGKGCKKCGHIATTKAQTLGQSQFEQKANKVHNNKYDYSKTNYVKMTDKVAIICPIHGEFEQKAASHVSQQQGCPICANITKAKKYHKHPTILYIIFFTSLNLYKIGITMQKRGVKLRYVTEKEPYRVIQEVLFEEGAAAYALEQKLLQKYKEYAYVGKKVLSNGNTELFRENILDKYFKED